ncbi:MAG: tRNA (adenosine(37)-N6)-threonylcarbamoyltransferase complex ATPase subunit type 1 TsaE [Clostridia bacterium]|nr:tRNA (adenosine(37)-N6)-threonylcarbamoyltransferase complex ATPase subunit type 1 TsaE [Clostridia bacterium]
MAETATTKEQKKFKSFDKNTFGKHSAAYVTKMAILTGLSFILYAFAKFNLPIFPSFLDIQISELPALLAGFSMGPISGCLVIVFKCLIKFSMTSTGFVGETTDILLGIAFVLPASLIYKYKKDIKHALLGLIVGTLVLTAAAILVNRFISVPFFAKMIELNSNGHVTDGFQVVVNSVSTLYKNVNKDNFYFYYLLVGVLPFNLFRCIIVSGLTFALYKRLSKILHWNGESWKKKQDEFAGGVFTVKSVEETYDLAEKLADILKGGEIVLLNGDLGAGKTTFTKGLALALGVTEEVTSPTFTIMNVYASGRLKLNHLDMYRVENSDELYELGVSEAVGEEGAVTVVEWNKFEDLDGNIISIDIKTLGETEREFEISLPKQAEQAESLHEDEAQAPQAQEDEVQEQIDKTSKQEE